jgi:hypothetical protein
MNYAGEYDVYAEQPHTKGSHAPKLLATAGSWWNEQCFCWALEPVARMTIARES